MSSCVEPVQQVQGPANPVPLNPLPAGLTRLVTDPNERFLPLPSAEVNTHLALARGIAEFCATLEMIGAGGTLRRFKRTFAQWQEPEEQQEKNFPYLAVDSVDAGVNDLQLTPSVEYEFTPDDPERRLVLVGEGEFIQKLRLDVYTTNPTERSDLLFALEQALRDSADLQFMTGIRLLLPFYFNQVAEFDLETLAYVQDAGDQFQRERKGILQIEGRVPAVRTRTLPVGRPQFVLQKVGLA